MNTTNIGRRKLIITAAGAGLGTLLAKRAAAQDTRDITFPSAVDAGRLHREGVQDISDTLGIIPISTKEGLNKLVDHLVAQGVITAKQADIVKQIIGAVFDSVNADHLPDLNKMADEIKKIYDTIEKKADDIALAIAGIAQDSVKYALEHIREIDSKTAQEFVASDVEGGISGAGMGAKFGKRGQIIGAIIGTVASSAWEAFRRSKTPKPR